MKKVIFGIFAHPDDEAFGPSGTLLKLGSEGYDIHLILLTDGEAGQNVDNVPDLAATRLIEWQKTTELLGAKTTHALHYPDGALETIPVSELIARISPLMTDILASYSEATEVSFMSFEPNGLTGHRDHIAASQLTAALTEQFPTHEIWYFCLDSTQAPQSGTAYYEPRAREDSYITTQVDITTWLEKKHRIMDTHYSQRTDAATIKALEVMHESFHIEKL